MVVSAAFDSGNIEVVRLRQPGVADLAIRKDHLSDFYQWFHFRVSGVAGVPLTLNIVNAGQSAYAEGWAGYRACVSEDRQTWGRTDTSYHAGVLTIRYTPRSDSAWFAYFAPYSMERHADLVARMAQQPRVTTAVLGQTLDGQDLDLITVGEPEPARRVCWLIARQHPGESMAQWWIEGVLERLTDPSDPVTTRLLDRAVFHIVPNMNPDGARRGHLRTNAVGVNLNREWHAPTLERSPEVYHALAAMDRTGCDFNLDVHGDEVLPYNFIAGFDGIPGLTARQEQLLADFKAALEQISPDFQTKVGYPVAKPGQANMSMSTNALAARFGCLAMTLEMPFKDTIDRPDLCFGWSPERSKQLGRACLDALLRVVDQLR
jgi:murein tripeptide amidase MpaA